MPWRVTPGTNAAAPWPRGRPPRVGRLLHQRRHGGMDPAPADLADHRMTGLGLGHGPPAAGAVGRCRRHRGERTSGPPGRSESPPVDHFGGAWPPSHRSACLVLKSEAEPAGGRSAAGRLEGRQGGAGLGLRCGAAGPAPHQGHGGRAGGHGPEPAPPLRPAPGDGGRDRVAPCPCPARPALQGRCSPRNWPQNENGG
jgi:hypothetical protein